ncbi:MAG TPA: glycosyltransferase [Pirellulaceae bacterium]|nr:glycosyltransferase [Pirellulaceae bacterium]
MAWFWFYLAASICASTALLWLQLAIGMSRVRWLRDIEPPDAFAWPKVSILVPARNEEREIAIALQSLLQLDYPDYEVLVINDRSTDRTGEILTQMQADYPQLQVATVTDLPGGWLGKNHALFFGAEQARGELLLFTDADIVMQPSTLRRSVVYFQREQLDHLAMAPACEMPTWFLEGFVVLFIMLFTTFTKPWKVRDPKSPAHVGIGAFNLLRKSAYQASGTHRAIAMRPDDDLKLGKLVKQHGFRQEMLNGSGFILVRWYSSVRELINGLMKNAFSGVDYHVGFTLFTSVSLLLINVWPFVAVWITTGAVRWLYAITIALHLISYSCVAWQAKARWWDVLAYPVYYLLFVYIQWRAMALTYWNDGIYWRDTHYSLAELKANKV